MFNDIYDSLINKSSSIAILGLGYAGIPLTYEFGKNINTIGFDIDEEVINKYKKGIDFTKQIGNKIKDKNIKFTNNESDISLANFIIVVVPTPVNEDNKPDLNPLKKACEILGRNIKKETIIVFESTVYPGATESICIPIIEKESNLKCGHDFKVGYSPERINPGDKIHTLVTTNKIISGMDEECVNEIEKVYSIICKNGLYKTSNIKTAEAIKVIENSQRDMNIAFMNEVSLICNSMEIDTKEVIEGMNTKWNALNFRPGLVGGHCLGVDPYYLIDEAKKCGYESKVIKVGREVNESMAPYIAKKTIKELEYIAKPLDKINVTILGISFKENCPDVRNSKVVDIYKELKGKNINVYISDYVVNKELVKKYYDIDLVDIEKLPKADCVIVAVAHDEYANISIKNLFKESSNRKILFDVKGIYKKEDYESTNIKYFSL